MKKETQVTQPVDTGTFTKEDEAALIGAAAAVAESDDAENKAVETFIRLLGTAPTLDIYVHAQRLFQSGYMLTSPATTPDALTKRTTRFFNRVLTEGGLTKPNSGNPVSEKKAEQREAEKEKILSEFKGVKPEAIEKIIKDSYAKLAASVPDSKEVKKELRKAETALRLMTADKVDAFKKQKAALVSSLKDAIKKCDDLNKLVNALKALK
jgi:hypothetical protein